MDPSFALDHRWWLEFQPDVNIEKNFVYEHMDGKKSDVTEENLQPNSPNCSALKATHNRWLEFQPDVNIEKNFVYEHMDGKKSDVTEENLQPNSPNCSALKATHNSCGQGKLCSPIPLCTNLELAKCSNVQTCEKNQKTMPQLLEVYEDDPAVEVLEESGHNIHMASVVDNCWEEILGKNKLVEGTGLERSIDYYLQSTNTKSYDKGRIAWRQADQRELASIVAIKSAEHLQNCDLPPPQSVWLGCRFLESSRKYKESNTSMTVDRDAKTSSGRSSMGLEGKALYSLQPSGFSSLPSLVSEANESLAVRTVSSDHFQDRMPRCNDRMSCSDGNAETTESDSIKLDILEALRRSQTRAREAEKTAELVILENEKLLSLLIREASHRNFYKQWLAVLQIENSKLRWQVKVLQSKDQGSPTCNTRVVSRRKKVVTNQDQCCLVNYQGRCYKKIKKSNSKRNGSWALAVALGLSLASVGLILGWSMGWIFPSI